MASSSAAIASLKREKHCLVVDKNLRKLQVICRNLEEEFALGARESRD